MVFEATDGKVPAVENIVPDGDVIMVVGAEKQAMRVSSHCLRYASKVFDAMLGPNWSEGQRPSESNPPKISLEEDDAEAMRTIFYTSPSHRDKYDLHVALQYAIEKWLSAGSPTMTEAGYGLTAAFIFDHPTSFETLSRSMMRSYEASYLELLKKDKIAQFLPFRTIYLLGEGRDRMRLSLLGIVSTAVKDCCGKGACEWGKKRKEAYIEFLSEIDPSRVQEMRVNSLINLMRRVTDESDMRKPMRCVGDSLGPTHKFPYFHQFAQMVDEITDEAGLCVDCVRVEGSCQFHEWSMGKEAIQGNEGYDESTVDPGQSALHYESSRPW